MASQHNYIYISTYITRAHISSNDMLSIHGFCSTAQTPLYVKTWTCGVYWSHSWHVLAFLAFFAGSEVTSDETDKHDIMYNEQCMSIIENYRGCKIYGGDAKKLQPMRSMQRIKTWRSMAWSESEKAQCKKAANTGAILIRLHSAVWEMYNYTYI